MYTITYSSKGYQSCFDNHYHNMKYLTNESLSVSGNFLGVLIEEIQLYLTQKDQKILSYEEYVHELLMLGTFWRIYADQASRIAGEDSLKFTNYDKKEKLPKSLTKPLKDFLSKMSTGKKRYSKSVNPELNLQNLDSLLYCLEEIGDFKNELKQLSIWREFLNTQDPGKVAEYLRSILLYADLFKKGSKLIIGDYGVEEYLNYLKLMGFEISNIYFKKVPNNL